MISTELLHNHLSVFCSGIHSARLQALFDVATGLQRSQNLSLTAIGRCLISETEIKHRVKKVDRLINNQHLYNELEMIYTGLSDYVFKYICQDEQIPIVVDLCFMKDTHDIQMLSAEVAIKGWSIPVYREVFEKNQLKNRAAKFISGLSKCIPRNRKVLIIMDAGFGDDWFSAIEAVCWYWLVRARGKKFIQLSETDAWVDARELYAKATIRATSFHNGFITKRNPRSCRIILKKSTGITQRKKPKKLPRNYNSANGNYQRSTKEPWVLVTNLPKEYTATHIVNYYKKRMQIEESFRDVKSHRFGLSARYIRTSCIYRWGIKMLLAAITQITLWIIGVIAHSQGFQRKFQTNTVRDRKVFSYFYLGKLVVEHNKLEELKINYSNISLIIEAELAKN